MRKITLLFICLLMSLVTFSQAIWFVDQYGDDNTGNGSGINPWATITHALEQASDYDVIIVSGTITGDGNSITGIVINKNITIKGERYVYSTIQADNEFGTADRRVITVQSGKTLNLKYINIKNGNLGTDGGGILVQGILNMQECIVEYNKTSGAGGGVLGMQNSIINIDKSIIRNNTCANGGGGISGWETNFNCDNSSIYNNSCTNSNGGGLQLYTSSVATFVNQVQNSTIYSNTAQLSGAGIYLANFGGTLNFNIQNCTISANSSGNSTAHGLYINALASTTINVAMQNCILDNGTSSNYAQNGSGTISFLRAYTIVRDNSMTGGGFAGNLNNTNPLLQTFGFYGGVTPVCPIASNSPAKNNGNSTNTPEKDQRGAYREGVTDIGSFEFRTSLEGNFTIDNSSPTDFPSGSNFNSFDEAINALNFGQITGGVSFDVTPGIDYIEPPLTIYANNLEDFEINFFGNDAVIKSENGESLIYFPSTEGDAAFYVVEPSFFTFNNLIIKNNTTVPNFFEEMEFGFAFIGNSESNVISDCSVTLNSENPAAIGIVIYSNSAVDNEVSFNTISNCAIGIASISENDDPLSTNSFNNFINNNIIQNIGNELSLLGSVGIFAQGQADSYIENNNISQISGLNCVGIFGNDCVDAQVNNNTISEITESANAIAINLQGNCSSSEITENTITNINATLDATGISASLNFLGMESVFINSNNINNLSAGLSVTGIITDSFVVQIKNNEISEFEATNYIFGISVVGTAQLNADEIFENTITGFAGTGNTIIVGINHSQLDDIGLGYRQIYKNQISDFENLSANGHIIALNIDNDASTKIYNNLIFDLRAPAFNVDNELAVAGISLSNATKSGIYYNTVLLDYVSTAENNSSAVLLIQDNAIITEMFNNIFVNNTDVTVGKYAIDILNATENYYCLSENMNNNLYFVGSLDGSAKQYIYIDDAISYMTLNEYKDFIQNLTTVTTESNSISENPPFISTAEPYDLHFNIGDGTEIQNGGIRITGMYPITDDFEGKLRYGEEGYTGGGISTDIGAYEMYEPVVTTTNAENVLFSTATLAGKVLPNNNEVTNIEFEYGTSPESYEFFIAANPATASGENEISVSANLTDLEMLTTYYYRIKAQCGILTFYGEELQFTTGEVGIENKNKSKIEIFPNPVNDFLTVCSEFEFNEILITDLTGKIIFENSENLRNIQIDLSKYLSGIYLIEIKTDDEIYKNKFFKE